MDKMDFPAPLSPPSPDRPRPLFPSAAIPPLDPMPRSIAPDSPFRFVALRAWLTGWRPVLLLSALGFLVWGGTLLNQFSYDDLDILFPRLRLFLHDPLLFFSRRYFSLSHEMSWRPAVTATYVADLAIWGLQPVGFHLTNIVLHTATAILWGRLARRMTGSLVAGWMAAVIALVHPAMSEAVCSVGFREEPLLTFGFLAALECWNFPHRFRWGGAWGLAGFGFFCLGLFAKESGVMLPLLTLLLWGMARVIGRETMSMRRLVALLGLQLVFVIAYLALAFGPFHAVGPKQSGYLGARMIEAVATFLWIHVRYVGLMIWPQGYAAHHPVEMVSRTGDLRWLAGTLFLLMIAIAMTGMARQGRWAAAAVGGWLWWFINLAPVSGLAPLPNPMAERYLYVPALGLGWMGVWGYMALRERLRRMDRTRAARRAKAIALAAAVLVLAWVHASVEQVMAYRSERTLWEATLRVEPTSTRALHNLGIAAIDRMDFRAAVHYLEEQLRINPGAWRGMIPLAFSYRRLGEEDRAERVLLRAVEIAPRHPDSHQALIRFYLNAKPARVEKALDALREAEQRWGVGIAKDLKRELQEAASPTP